MNNPNIPCTPQKKDTSQKLSQVSEEILDLFDEEIVKKLHVTQ
jgi:hypothetical protein